MFKVALIGISAAFLAAAAGVWWTVTPQPAVEPTFELSDTDGRVWSQDDLRGQPAVVAFAFSHCPDICPTTLANIASWKADLGASAARTRWIIVALDPDRDAPGGDPAPFRSYIDAFDAGFMGFWGSEADIVDVTRAFRVARSRVEVGSGTGAYTIDHSTLVYVLDANARVVNFLAHDAPSERAQSVLERVLQ